MTRFVNLRTFATLDHAELSELPGGPNESNEPDDASRNGNR